MSLLFDVSESGGKKSARARAKEAPPPTPEQKPKKTAYLYRESGESAGSTDDTHICDRCGSSPHDIIRHEDSESLIGCVYCSLMTWVPRIRQPHAGPEQFRFRDGLFAGKTPAEAALEPRGQEYLTWAASSHPRPSVRQAVKTYLDSMAVGR